MKNKIKTLLVAFSLFLSLVAGIIFPHTINASKTENDGDILFPDSVLYSNNTDEEMYVELNNELVNAINDYNNNLISESEFLKICDYVQSHMDTNKEMKKLQESEEAYYGK